MNKQQKNDLLKFAKEILYSEIDVTHFNTQEIKIVQQENTHYN